jgi:hypothetical protein
VDAQVHALLRFLLDTGFNLVPVPQGLDERGREVLSWLEGTPGYRPWPAALLSDEGVVELAGVMTVVEVSGISGSSISSGDE